MDHRFSITAKGIKSSPGSWLAPKLMKVVQRLFFESVEKGNVIINSLEAGSYVSSFVISGIMCFVAAALILTVKQPKAK
jgi:hypothetical protein